MQWSWMQVEQAQAGLESLSSSEKTVNQLRENFVSIEMYAYDAMSYGFNFFFSFLKACTILHGFK